MQVRQLIERLRDLPPDSIVILSSDREGNSFSPLSDLDANYNYVADTTWSGDLTEDYEEGVPAVILVPVN